MSKLLEAIKSILEIASHVLAIVQICAKTRNACSSRRPR